MPRDWILLALSQSATRALQPLPLQKALCLFAQKLPRSALQCDTFYDFSPNDYGPFSAEVYSDIEELANSGLVVVSHDAWPARHFVLTPRGYESAALVLPTVPPDATRTLAAVVAWVTAFEIRDLLKVDLATFNTRDSKQMNSTKDGLGDCAFIAGVETWGSGGQPLDIVTLKDGSVLLITEATVVLYESVSAFERNVGGRILSRQF